MVYFISAVRSPMIILKNKSYLPSPAKKLLFFRKFVGAFLAEIKYLVQNSSLLVCFRELMVYFISAVRAPINFLKNKSYLPSPAK